MSTMNGLEGLYDGDEIARLNSMKLIHEKKLGLVLDLDHTLLNSIPLFDVEKDAVENLLEDFDSYLNPFSNSLKNNLFKTTFSYGNVITKLRPFVHDFLKEASEMFELYIYTMGTRDYALKMAKLLDPKNVYFGSRIISRDDSFFENHKSLELVPVQERHVLIMDDTHEVWTDYIKNLIVMKRYHFFASSLRGFRFPKSIKSLAQRKVDEREDCGALASVLAVLKRVHHAFFKDGYENVLDRDVRGVLKDEKKHVLQGCKILFCREFLAFSQKNRALLNMALQLGAQCCLEHDEFVTHVVAKYAIREQLLWAIKENKYFVLPQWIEAANYLWKKLPEENFLVNTTTNKSLL